MTQNQPGSKTINKIIITIPTNSIKNKDFDNLVLFRTDLLKKLGESVNIEYFCFEKNMKKTANQKTSSYSSNTAKKIKK